MKKKTNTEESRDGKKQNQCNERHLRLSQPYSIQEMPHDQTSFWNCNHMKLWNRKFPSEFSSDENNSKWDDFKAEGEF